MASGCGRWRKEGRTGPRDVVAYSTGRGPNYMIRRGDLKLMMADSEASPSVDALHDLEADPLEMRNLIVSPLVPKRNREQAKRMKARLVEWLHEHEPSKVEGVADRPLFR